MVTDPFALLGLSPGCSLEELKAAYRVAARRAHPDAGGSEEAFLAVRAAYESLIDPARRAGPGPTSGTSTGPTSSSASSAPNSQSASDFTTARTPPTSGRSRRSSTTGSRRAASFAHEPGPTSGLFAPFTAGLYSDLSAVWLRARARARSRTTRHAPRDRQATRRRFLAACLLTASLLTLRDLAPALPFALGAPTPWVLATLVLMVAFTAFAVFAPLSPVRRIALSSLCCAPVAAWVLTPSALAMLAVVLLLAYRQLHPEQPGT